MNWPYYILGGFIACALFVWIWFGLECLRTTDRYAPSKESKQAERSAAKALRDAQL